MTAIRRSHQASLRPIQAEREFVEWQQPLPIRSLALHCSFEFHGLALGATAFSSSSVSGTLGPP